MRSVKWFSIETVEFRGHPNVKASHKTTFEVTKETHLTPRGDCIVGVEASKGLKEFSDEFRQLVRDERTKVFIAIITEDGSADTLMCQGSSSLTLEDPVRIIVRKSSYTAPNTLCIKASKAAAEIDRALITSLKEGKSGLLLAVAFRPPQ